MAQGCGKRRYDCNSGNPWLQGFNGRVLTSGLGVVGMTEDTCEEQETIVMPGSHREICPPVGPRCRPEDRECTETVGTGELSHEGGVGESDKLPEAVVPDGTLPRGGAQYNLRPRIHAPLKLKDYEC
ncbi:hypothetical protein NDU88_003866 [Pleurodeles waltl]|uniref:Uncharacterized protein n=1 Tax=Pleurodeles waltl TaxID=8319 RepID=A0AAV7KW54_PLEWA|nr:hypothetical protein NDU88_003866 [Pleurodeles waltl]